MYYKINNEICYKSGYIKQIKCLFVRYMLLYIYIYIYVDENALTFILNHIMQALHVQSNNETIYNNL